MDDRFIFYLMIQAVQFIARMGLYCGCESQKKMLDLLEPKSGSYALIRGR